MSTFSKFLKPFNHLVFALILLSFGIYGVWLTSHSNSHALAGNVVVVPAFGTCGTDKQTADQDVGDEISQWINDPNNVPSGTPGDPTIVTFGAPCYDIEGTIFFDGGGSTTTKDGECFQRPFNGADTKKGDCSVRRHDIVFDGTGTVFQFLSDGYMSHPSKGEDYFGQNGYGFSYEDMKWYILGGDSLTFQNIDLQGPSFGGLSYITANDGAAGMEIAGAQNVIVQNNTFSHTFSDFITLLGYHPLGGDMNEAPDYNINILNNNFSYSGRQGISPDDVNLVTISGNTLSHVTDVDYDLETDTTAEVIDNVTIDNNMDDGGGAAWVEDNAGAHGVNGPPGNSSNIIVEHDTVKYALHVINSEGGACSQDKPLQGLTIIDNTALGAWDNVNPLMLISCVATPDIEGNTSPDVSYYNQTVIDVGEDTDVTIKNNNFPQRNVNGVNVNPKTGFNDPALNLIGPKNHPDAPPDPNPFIHCGNVLLSGKAPTDGSCNVPPPPPPPPVCPGGETGTPPNCKVPVTTPSKTGSGSTTPTPKPAPVTTKSPTPTTTTPKASTAGPTSGPTSTGSVTNPVNQPTTSLTLPMNINLSTVSETCYSVDNKSYGCVTKSPFNIMINTKNLSNTCHVETVTIHYFDGTVNSVKQPLCVKNKVATPWSAILFGLASGMVAGALVLLNRRKQRGHHKKSKNSKVVVGGDQ